MRKETVCVDFDGVIYPNIRYRGVAVLKEKPIEGAKESLAKLSKKYNVIIHSGRMAHDEGVDAIETWMIDNGMSYPLSRYKPPADYYIDDRAICFNGDWNNILYEIDSFKQWQHEAKTLAKLNRKIFNVSKK